MPYIKFHAMKTKSHLFQNLILAFILTVSATVTQAQKTDLQTAIDNKQFIFDAQTVLPTNGTVRQINGERYQIRISGDSLLSELPYFGRAYVAPVNGEGGMHFTSSRFKYSYTPRKKGGWEILIQPKDVSDVREFMLTVSESGSATLRALSDNRQPILFNGQVHAI